MGFLCPSNIGADKKREGIQTIWDWSGSELDLVHPLLGDDVLGGIGSGGTGYNTNRWRELVYVIRLMKRYLNEDESDRARLLGDGWALAEWLEDLPENRSRQFRHMLLFLLDPDHFERIFGGTDRRQIVSSFLGLSRAEAGKLTPLEIDRRLYEIRQQQIQEYETEELDFYHAPLRDPWQKRRSGTYLMTWNPQNWGWPDFEEDCQRTAAGKRKVRSWSCHSKQPVVGDRAFLLRTGIEPRGIIAIENIVRESYEDPHWDPAKAGAGESQSYVDVEFTRIRDPATEQFITKSDLSEIKVGNQDWAPQRSGIEIKRKAAGILEKRWSELDPVGGIVSQADSDSTNLILYGPPGTGKTYRLNQMAEDYTDSAEKVPEDEWVESLVSDLSWSEAAFDELYEMGGRAKAKEIADHPYVAAKARSLGRTRHISNQIWASLQGGARLESKTVHVVRRYPPFVFDKTEDGRWELVDDWEDDCSSIIEVVQKIKKGQSGSETSFKRYVMVTFHQAYGYEDFVEGIRPQVSEGASGEVSYSVEPGVFRRICQRAKNDPDRKYAIFIDEVNRGNIAKILGELITLIEPDKRAVYSPSGELAEGMELTLPYSGDQFGVPRNLDIIATMNTADRSIALLDTALRRRFRFEELMPDAGVISGAAADGCIPDGQGGEIDLRALLDAVNRRMRFLLHRDQTLGHAYFTEVTDFPGLKRVLFHQVIPLLQEYFYEDWHRIQLVFGDVGSGGAKREPQIICHRTVREEEVLGFDHDDYEDSIEYWVSSDGDLTPDAVRKVYEPD